MRVTYVVNKDEPGSTGKEESTSPISPSESSDGSRNEESHGQKEREVVLVLPPNDPVLRQVRDIGNSNLSSWLDNHPANVSPPETFVGRVWVELGVGVSVVCPVTSGPPFDGPLNGSSTCHRQGELKRGGSVV